MRYYFLLIILFGCQTNKNPIEKALHSHNSKIQTVTENLKKHELQILFTKILTKNDTILFEDYSYNVNDENYFYPASSVKFPIAILSLEKLNKNPLIDRNTPFMVFGDSIKTTIAKEITKIFAVSDNEAYNNLFEFLGQDAINQELNNKGFLAIISHRFTANNSGALTTKPVNFYKNDSLIYTYPSTTNAPLEKLKLKNTLKGVGYTRNDSLIKSPMDFSMKNYLPVATLHNIMKCLQFPEKFPKKDQFDLSESDREFLLNQMKILPNEAGYFGDEYYDGYVKLFLFGDSKNPKPNYIDIYNKVGYAYGYLTDCAYIINKKTKKSYIITATIHVNENQIYNDGIYEYDTIGIPFLAELGRQLTKFK